MLHYRANITRLLSKNCQTTSDQATTLRNKRETPQTISKTTSQASRAIHKIRTRSGEILTDPIKINESFVDFYKEVYMSKGHTDINELNQFLSTINLPQLSEEAVRGLEAEITSCEIAESNSLNGSRFYIITRKHLSLQILHCQATSHYTEEHDKAVPFPLIYLH